MDSSGIPLSMRLQHGSLTPNYPQITLKANNGFIFSSISKFVIARYSKILYNVSEVILMRLGWTKNKNSTTYRALKTIRVNGKNRTLVIKTFGSHKFIRQT